MERYYACANGHSFKVESDEKPKNDAVEVYFKVLCPHCAEPYEIRWPSTIAFRIVAE
jgi:hypothetical protein